MPASITSATCPTAAAMSAPDTLLGDLGRAGLAYPGIPAIMLRRTPEGWCVEQVLTITRRGAEPTFEAMRLHCLPVTDAASDKQAMVSLKRLAGAEYGVSAWAAAPGEPTALVPAALAAAMPR